MSKYRNEPTLVDGIRFASKKEALRWGELKLLERAGEITNLVRQPRYSLEVNGVNVAFYVGDFDYFDARSGFAVTEDVKGVQTPLFKLKRRMFQAMYRRDITLT